MKETTDKIVSPELLKEAVDKVVEKVSEFERLEIVGKLKELFLTRLRNEYYIAEMIKVGVDGDVFAADEAIKMLKDSKDNLDSLGKLLRLFEGESTSNTESSVTVNHVDVEERVSRLLSRN